MGQYSIEGVLLVLRPTKSCGEGRARCAARQLPPSARFQAAQHNQQASISAAAPEPWRFRPSALHILPMLHARKFRLESCKRVL